MASGNDGGVCSVSGCDAEGERSLAAKKVLESGLPLKSEGAKKANLCKAHYREYKKATKRDRTLETLGR